MKADSVVVEQISDASIAVVWKAIIESIAGFEPEVGFETRFNVRCEGQDFLHLWKVTDVVLKQYLARSG